MINRVLGKIVTLRAGEAHVALLMFAYSFLAMGAYNILKPITKSKFIYDLGADNQPIVLLVAGVLMGVVMHAYSRAMRPVPRRLIIPVTQTAIAVLLVAFWALLQTGAAWVSAVFYFVGLLLGVFLISQFWMLANDIYDARQAKRLFGFIGGGSSLGGAAGSYLTFLYVERLGPTLLLFSAAALMACVVIASLILRRRALAPGGDFVPEEVGVGGREALRLLGESRHLRIVALVIAFAAAAATIVDQQLSMALDEIKGERGEAYIAAFLAWVNTHVSVIGFVVQVAVTSRIHRSLGLAFALLLLPVGFGVTSVIILGTGALWAAAVARGMDQTLRYTVDKTSREVLFLPLPADLKYRAKPFIDVTAEKIAKGAAALLLLVLIQDWGLGLDWRALSYVSLTMIALWVLTTLAARREYLKAFRDSIGARTIGPDAVRTEVDAATVETLVEELSNPDEIAVLYAIDMLEAVGKRHLVTPLLLHHDSPRVRARALRALAAGQSRTARRWIAMIERMVHDDDVDVRAAALRALAELSDQDARALMRRHLADHQPRIAVTAAVALANTGGAEDVDAAEQALKQLIADTREVAAPGRREAAAALAHIRSPRFRSLLVPLIHDADVAVAQEAIGSARAMGAADGLFVPGLMSLLAQRPLKAAARDALVGFGEPAIDALAYALRDPREDVWVRRHIPATLARIGTARAMDALVASLDDADGFLRYKAIAAIETMRREHPGVPGPGAVVETLLSREAMRYFAALTLRQDIVDHSRDAEHTLLTRALQDKLDRAKDRIFRLLGLLHGIEDVAAARHAIEYGDARRRAAALEFLDNVLGGTVRKRAMPILDDTSVADRVRLGHALLKGRPRELDDTLAQLVHDDDPVIAAAAIHFIATRNVWTLAADVEYVAARRPREDRAVLEAATWALAMRASRQPHGDFVDSLPAVEFANRVSGISLFSPASVDELFRIAEIAQEIHYHPGRQLRQVGDPADGVLILLEGSVRHESLEMTAPAVLGFEEVLRGMPSAATIDAIEHCTCFRIPAGDFLSMVSDDVLLAQGLFQLLLSGSYSLRPPFTAPGGDAASDVTAGSAAIDRALLLRHDPLLARASAPQLLALTATAREVPFAAGSLLFDADAPPAITVILSGSVLLESDVATPLRAAPGTTIGVADTLAGWPIPWRATGADPGLALHIERSRLFELLADDTALMQELFGGILGMRAAAGVPS